MMNIQEHIFNQANSLCEKIYESLPDGIHTHADGNLYLHRTWCDPRNPNNKGVKTIEKI